MAEDAAEDTAQPASDSLETRIAELEAAVGDSADWEPDGSEDEVGAEQTVVVPTGSRMAARTRLAQSRPWCLNTPPGAPAPIQRMRCQRQNLSI
ncbi:MAG: hypothetical protein CR964_01705 [Rhodobacterales bacterium]|nr:MAG: hypothetical protein CR964_01705 [Rhodobacterales bacterium]